MDMQKQKVWGITDIGSGYNFRNNMIIKSIYIRRESKIKNGYIEARKIYSTLSSNFPGAITDYTKKIKV